MSVLNKEIRAWWIQKHNSCNIANKVEFCDFKPDIHDKDHEWVRVISLDDFHKQAGMNITRWVGVCNELASSKEKIKELEDKLKEASEVIGKIATGLYGRPTEMILLVGGVQVKKLAANVPDSGRRGNK